MIFLAMIEAILDGIVLVLCPLLSLMHDQVLSSKDFLIIA
jgi:superfamily II DNA helicase RecQ